MTEQPASWTVQVESTCAGSGLCAAAAPDHFTIVDNRSQPTSDAVPAGDDVILAAAELCPMEAIVVRDAATGRSIGHPGAS